MDSQTIRAILTSFAQELGKLGLRCRLEDLEGSLDLTIIYKPYQEFRIHFDPDKGFWLHPPNDEDGPLPVEIADPQCYEKLAAYLHANYPKYRRKRRSVL
jgi:hypothetical protein